MSDHTLNDSPIFRVHIPDEDGLHWRSLISNLETGGILERLVPCEHGNTGKHAVVSASYAPEEQRATKWDIKWCDGE